MLTHCWDEVINAWFDKGNGLEHVHLCTRMHTAFLVPMGLQNPVAFPVIGSPLTILAPVMGMLFLPASSAVLLVGLVIGIGAHFVALPLGFSGPLAALVGTEPLGFHTGIRQKTTATMGTATDAVHGCLLSEATNLLKWPQTGRIRTITKADAEGKAANRNEASGEEQPSGQFSQWCPWITFSPLKMTH